MYRSIPTALKSWRPTCKIPLTVLAYSTQVELWRSPIWKLVLFSIPVSTPPGTRACQYGHYRIDYLSSYTCNHKRKHNIARKLHPKLKTVKVGQESPAMHFMSQQVENSFLIISLAFGILSRPIMSLSPWKITTLFYYDSAFQVVNKPNSSCKRRSKRFVSVLGSGRVRCATKKCMRSHHVLRLNVGWTFKNNNAVRGF